jgi:hypothetical protein
MFAYGSSESDPSCFELSVDANGDGDYDDADDWDAEEICIP